MCLDVFIRIESADQRIVASLSALQPADRPSVPHMLLRLTSVNDDSESGWASSAQALNKGRYEVVWVNDGEGSVSACSCDGTDRTSGGRRRHLICMGSQQ
ncbi:hypothetical protein CesoFtcFv8_019389 [Champsocephalus esox]|uniref:Uncharacterized protein n=2 Tax=Champsocephalus TaxID=52236 RepID=A0AAN8CWC8_CHAGU|nr:hypothetical protein CesoFtcFv8_019389 [Champsocephalus esox]KAK5910649.1 hypothetical protein CgunFtcFv8_004893 [Champsocephalus gunnari]